MRLWGLLLFIAAACGDGETDPHRRPGPPMVFPPADAAPTARDTVGVPACDAYLDDFGRCIRRMDRAAQPAARRALESLRQSWLESARTAEGTATLAHACQLAADAARAATSGIGCAF